MRPLVRDGLVALMPDATDGRIERGVLGADGAATLRALADQVSSDEFLAAYGQRPWGRHFRRIPAAPRATSAGG